MSCTTTETNGVAGRYDGFVIYADTDWSVTVTYYANNGETPINLTDYTARAVFASEGHTSLELTTENGRISLGGVDGTVALTLTDTVTATMAAAPYTYGIELIDGSGIKTPFLFGTITVKADITPAVS